MTTRPVLPGGPIIEHIKSTPTPLIGIGAVLMLVGILAFLVAFSLAEHAKIPKFIWLGFAGGLMVLAGLTLMVYDIERMKRREKKPGS